MVRRRTLLQAAGWLGLAPLWARAATTRPVLRVAVFPDYNVTAVLEAFQQAHGVEIQLDAFNSNEDLLAACVGGARYDLLTLSHYMVPHFATLGLLRPVSAALLSALAPAHWHMRLAQYGRVDQQWLAVPKNSGTTGFLYRQSRLPALTDWRGFWDAAMSAASRRCSVLDDVQTLIGAALRYDEHSLNSTRPGELLQAEQLLQRCRPHLRSMTAEVDEALAHGDWLAMAWSDTGYWLSQQQPDLRYVYPRGGEQWCDFYAISRSSNQVPLVEKLLAWLLAPEQIAQEVVELGVSPVDERVIGLLPDTVRRNTIVFPAADDLARAEMSSQEALREPLRGEIFARFAASF